MFKITIGNSCTINAKFDTIGNCFFQEDAFIVKKLINMILIKDKIIEQKVQGTNYHIECVG